MVATSTASDIAQPRLPVVPGCCSRIFLPTAVSVDGDGVTDVLDASLCEAAVNSFNEVFTPESDPYGAFEEAADFNGDGFCDIDDYSAIVNDALKA